VNFDLIIKHWDLFLNGVWTTVTLTGISLLIGLIIALPCALSLSHNNFFAPLVRLYVYVFRGSPLLVQIYLVYYGLSQFEFVRESWAWVFLREAWWCAIITIALNSGAYTAEIFRGAIATMPRGEVEGARALGLSDGLVDWLIVLPSSLRRALPQYSNEVVFTLHGSAVCSVITIQDILGVGRTVNSKYYVAYEGFLTAAALYLVITYLLVMLFRVIEDYLNRHLQIADTKKSTRSRWARSPVG